MLDAIGLNGKYREHGVFYQRLRYFNAVDSVPGLELRDRELSCLLRMTPDLSASDLQRWYL